MKLDVLLDAGIGLTALCGGYLYVNGEAEQQKNTARKTLLVAGFLLLVRGSLSSLPGQDPLLRSVQQPSSTSISRSLFPSLGPMEYAQRTLVAMPCTQLLVEDVLLAIKEIQRRLSLPMEPMAGSYRIDELISYSRPPSVKEIPSRMERFAREFLKTICSPIKGGKFQVTQQATRMHRNVVAIHPFKKKNNEVGEVLVNVVILRHGEKSTLSIGAPPSTQSQLPDSFVRVNNEGIFTHIYESGLWGKNTNGKGHSGLGSILKNVKAYVFYLEEFLKKEGIRSVVDLGCGDWSFSQYLNWNDIEYTGIDVVKQVIKENQKRFSASNIRFMHADGSKRALPSADLLICKDVLQHLPNQEIALILKECAKFKYCLFTNDAPEVATDSNQETYRGGWRPLDLTQPPFSLKGKKVLDYVAHGSRKMALLVQA